MIYLIFKEYKHQAHYFTETCQLQYLHKMQPIIEVVPQKIYMAEMAVTVVSNMLDRSRMVGPLTPSMSP